MTTLVIESEDWPGAGAGAAKARETTEHSKSESVQSSISGSCEL